MNSSSILLGCFAGITSYIIMITYPFTILIFGGLVLLIPILWVLYYIVVFIYVMLFDRGDYNHKSGNSYLNIYEQLYSESVTTNLFMPIEDEYKINEDDYKIGVIK